MYGFSWSFAPSTYRVSIDSGTTVTLNASSSLPAEVSSGRVYVAGLTFFQTNLANSSHTLTVDNDLGVGQIGLDYVEVVSVTGGTP